MIDQIFTKEFNNIVKWYFVYALLKICSTYVGMYFGFDVYGIHELNDSASSIFRVCSLFVYISVFWYAISLLTKDKRSCLIVALLSFFCLACLNEFVRNLNDSEIDFYDVMLLRMAIHFISFAFFGWLHFKNKVGLWLGLVGLVSMMSFYFGSVNQYLEFIDAIFPRINYQDFTEYLGFKIQRENNSYTIVSFFNVLASALFMVNSILFAWVGIVFLKSKSRKSFFYNLDTSKISDFTAYVIVHWSTRIFLLAALYNAGRSAKYFISIEPAHLLIIIILIMFVLKIFVLGSIYRNLLIQNLLSIKKYPSWFYFFMQLPIIHIFFWMYMIMKKILLDKNEKSSLDQKKKNMLDLRSKYLSNDKNQPMFFFFLITSIVYLLVKEGIFDQSADPLIPAISIAVFVLVAFWFVKKSAAHLYLLIAYVLLIFVLIIIDSRIMSFLNIGAVCFSLIVYYPLFHFDKFSLDSDEDFASIEISAND